MSLSTIALIVNTVLCIVGFVPAFGVQIAAVMGGSAIGHTTRGTIIAIIGYVFPALPIVSIIVSWLAYLFGSSAIMVVGIAAPWVSLAVLALLILLPSPSRS